MNITTAISYTNGNPHIGHAYELVIADVIKRYYKLINEDIFLQTGTDEHGQKIETSALKDNLPTKLYCDKYAEKFLNLSENLLISYDKFVRTTDFEHKKKAIWLWNKVEENGDIYLSKYEGYYSVINEQYITEKEAALTNYLESNGNKYEKKSEEAYFFRLSKYKEKLIEVLSNDILKPDNKEILSFLESEELLDLCISRTTCKWGIPIKDTNHVMYVWFDALANYLTKTLKEDIDDYELDIYVHLIGKDIIRHHSVYWLAILISAGLKLPKYILSHGHITDKNGIKMSKSLGNIIDPNEIIQKYSLDAFRLYVIKDTILGQDLHFNEEILKNIHNGFLLKDLGNLWNRLITLFHKNNDPNNVSNNDYKTDLKYKKLENPLDLNLLKHNCKTYMEKFELNKYANELCESIKKINKYITELEPWKQSYPLNKYIVIKSLECLYFICNILKSIIPIGSTKILNILNQDQIDELSVNYDNLNINKILKNNELLYKIIY